MSPRLPNDPCHSTTLLHVAHIQSVSKSQSHLHTVAHTIRLSWHFLTLPQTGKRSVLTPVENSLSTLLTHHIMFSLWLLLRCRHALLLLIWRFGLELPSYLGTKMLLLWHSMKCFLQIQKSKVHYYCFVLTFPLGSASQSIWHPLFPFLSWTRTAFDRFQQYHLTFYSPLSPVPKLA